MDEDIESFQCFYDKPYVLLEEEGVLYPVRAAVQFTQNIGFVLNEAMPFFIGENIVEKEDHDIRLKIIADRNNIAGAQIRVMRDLASSKEVDYIGYRALSSSGQLYEVTAQPHSKVMVTLVATLFDDHLSFSSRAPCEGLLKLIGID